MNGWLFYTIVHGTLVLLGITHPLLPLWLEKLEHVNFKTVYVKVIKQFYLIKLCSTHISWNATKAHFTNNYILTHYSEDQ